MQNLLQIVYDVLKQDERLISTEWELLKNKIQELANGLDENLIELLLSDETMRTRFFKQIKECWVFDSHAFIRFINNKEFLPDSYTSFKNKIGLVDSNENFIADTNDVVLNRPYKDCVLAWGQDTEDAKRDEIFYNEILWSDQIDRLLDPKVFTNFKKYDKDGEHTFTEWTKDENGDIKDNLIIKGNNLLALHSIEKKFAGKVKLIYIDPPFNTGNDTFKYNDKFSRSTRLTFMKNRLEVARDLLHDDGNIFIHIDVNQSHYLKVICDQVFKEQNFVQEIIWAYWSPSWWRAAGAKPVNIHDYIIHYSKSYSQRKQKKIYIPYSEKYIKDWFKYTDNDWRVYRRRMTGKNENGESVRSKQYLEESKWIPLSTVRSDIYQVYADPRAYKENQSHRTELQKEFSWWQKPEELIKRIIEMSTDEWDLILDYHLWTWTTSVVAHKLKRQYIWIEQMDYIDKFTIKRLLSSIEWDEKGISKSIDRQWWWEFVYMEIAKKNQNIIEQINNAHSSQECVALYHQIKESGFINYIVDIKTIDANISDFESLSIDDMKRFLITLLDQNALYVNYSEMNDKDSNVSSEDKALNTGFYA